MAIPKPLYDSVRQRAQFRCEYCHYPELLSSAPPSIDHIHPQSLGGSDEPDNLALACRRCNDERREEPFIQNDRQQWIAAQLHPPNDDPRARSPIL